MRSPAVAVSAYSRPTSLSNDERAVVLRWSPSAAAPTTATPRAADALAAGVEHLAFEPERALRIDVARPLALRGVVGRESARSILAVRPVAAGGEAELRWLAAVTNKQHDGDRDDQDGDAAHKLAVHRFLRFDAGATAPGLRDQAKSSGTCATPDATRVRHPLRRRFRRGMPRLRRGTGSGSRSAARTSP